MRKLTLLLISVFCVAGLFAQTGCPDCNLSLPELPEDTIYISPLPDGVLGSEYQADVSFRLPKTTTPVAATDTTVIPGLTIDEIVVTGISGLPAGLSWEASQDTFNVRELTDACARFCGIPQTRGVFRLEITLQSRIFVITQESIAYLDLYIAPSNSSTAGFSMENSTACGSSRVVFRNNNPSLGAEGFQYFWDFGNGKTSTEENPAPQDYVSFGEYEVTYQAIIDTAQARLQKVTILEGDCNDLIGRPDYYISVTNPEGEEIYVARHLENPRLPVSFELNIPLEDEGTYLLQVNDEDSGIEGSDDNCALIPFTVQDSLLTLDGVVATLEIINPIDTINASDSVIVYPFPASPNIALSGSSVFCEGGSATLKATPYEDNLQWSKDGQAIAGASGNIYEVTNSGLYTVSYTSVGGCTVVAMPIEVQVNELPAIPMFDNTDNLLTLIDESILDENSSLQWYLEDELLEDENDISLCATTFGNYKLEITDLSTGCVNEFVQAVEYDSKINNCNLSSTNLLVLEAFKLYPNPTSNWLNIEFDNTFQQRIELSVIDLLGRVHQQFQMENNRQNLDMSNLPNGVYYLQFKTADKVMTSKVVKE